MWQSTLQLRVRIHRRSYSSVSASSRHHQQGCCGRHQHSSLCFTSVAATCTCVLRAGKWFVRKGQRIEINNVALGRREDQVCLQVLGGSSSSSITCSHMHCVSCIDLWLVLSFLQ